MIKLTLSLLLISINIFAASWATVTAKKAIIYSDAEMTSKLGFIPTGKKVRIGDVAKNKGQVYPLVYQKKVVYIKKIDIQTSSELLALQSAMERITKKSMTMETFQRIAIGASLGGYKLSSEKSYSSEKDKTLVFTGFTFSGYIVRPAKRSSVRLQFSYQSAEKKFEEYSYINLEVYYHLEILKHKRLSVDIFGGLIFTPHFGYSVGSDFSQNGTGYGVGAGTELIYMLTKRWSTHLNLEMRYHKLSVGLPTGVSPSEYSPSLVGLNTSLLFSYSYE